MSGMIRKLDELGRIVLPKEMRNKMGAGIGAAFDISSDGKDTFTIILVDANKCSACGAIEVAFAKFGDIRLCENCVDDVIESKE